MRCRRPKKLYMIWYDMIWYAWVVFHVMINDEGDLMCLLGYLLCMHVRTSHFPSILKGIVEVSRFLTSWQLIRIPNHVLYPMKFSSRVMTWDCLSTRQSTVASSIVEPSILNAWLNSSSEKIINWATVQGNPSLRSRTHGACNNTEVCGLQVAIDANVTTWNASFVVDKSSFRIVYRIEAASSS
jgi:hypothetical protein